MDYVSVMATTTHQADELPARPVPFHLCDDSFDDICDDICDDSFDDSVDDTIDDDRDFDDLSGSELIDLEAVLSADNARSHAECPAPDFHGLPSANCVVYRASAPANVRTEPGDEPFIELIAVSSTTLSEVMYEALAVACRLQDATVTVSMRTWSLDTTAVDTATDTTAVNATNGAPRVVVTRTAFDIGAEFRGFSKSRSRGMGRELDVKIVRANPEVLGFWHRDVAEEALVAALEKLPVPPRVPVEARAVQSTERPGALRSGRAAADRRQEVPRWQRLNASDVCERGAA